MTLQEQLSETVVKWRGVPYVHRGTTRSGCDCTGLLIGALGEIYPTLRYPLRRYPKDWNLHAMAGDYIREELSKVAVPIERGAGPGDIILFYFGRCVAHCGVLSGPAFVFYHSHVLAGQVVASTLRTVKWRKRCAGYWRVMPDMLEQYL